LREEQFNNLIIRIMLIVTKITKKEKYNPRNKSDANENNCSPPTNRCLASPRAAALCARLPSSLLLSMKPYGVEHPFGQLGSAVLAVSPPNFWCTLSLLALGVV